MKAYRDEEKFEPVHLILESQDEVDALYAIVNHSRVRGFLGLSEGAYEAIAPFGKDSRFDSLDEFLKTYGTKYNMRYK